MKKEDRQRVKDKTNGKCYYCGCNLSKRWHVDHIFPKNKSHWIGSEPMMRPILEKGASHAIDFDIDDFENLAPSCPRCNNWKHSSDLEQFRDQISNLVVGLQRDSSQFRMALDFDLIELSGKSVEFYFEKMKKIGKL